MQWRKAASVILLNTELRQVLMLKRGPKAKFMPSAYVFPGGIVEKIDAAFPKELTNRYYGGGDFNDPDAERYGTKVGALRELFEESGLLLVDGQLWNAAEDKHLEDWRQKVMRDPSQFPQLYSSNNRLDLKSPIYWSNWLTPIGLPKRFDASYFVVRTNSSPQTRFDEKEMSHAEWGEPSKLLERCCGDEPSISLPPPMFYELLRLRIASYANLGCMANPNPILPQIIRAREDENLYANLLPGDHLYKEGDGEPRVMTRELVLPPTEEESQLPIHRTTHVSDPERRLEYTKHEIHLRNLDKRSSHLFYWTGNIETTTRKRGKKEVHDLFASLTDSTSDRQ